METFELLKHRKHKPKDAEAKGRNYLQQAKSPKTR